MTRASRLRAVVDGAGLSDAHQRGPWRGDQPRGEEALRCAAARYAEHASTTNRVQVAPWRRHRAPERVQVTRCRCGIGGRLPRVASATTIHVSTDTLRKPPGSREIQATRPTPCANDPLTTAPPKGDLRGPNQERKKNAAIPSVGSPGPQRSTRPRHDTCDGAAGLFFTPRPAFFHVFSPRIFWWAESRPTT